MYCKILKLISDLSDRVADSQKKLDEILTSKCNINSEEIEKANANIEYLAIMNDVEL